MLEMIPIDAGAKFPPFVVEPSAQMTNSRKLVFLEDSS